MPFWRRQDRIASEADAWVARLQGPDTAKATEGLAAWRSTDPRHEAAYRRSAALWSATAGATRTRLTVSGDAAGWRSGATSGRRYALASLVVLFVAISLTLLLWRTAGSPVGQTAGYASRSDPGILRLADGSTVLIGRNSLVVPHFDGTIRAITLVRGEARFRVAHDAAHPFVVTAADRTVTARGTIFDVALQTSGLSVTMVEGVVDVGHRTPGAITGPAVIRLRGGDRLTVAQAHRSAIPASGEATVTETVDYAPTILAQVVADADRSTARPIRLADTALGHLRVQGRFDLADTQALARQLAAALSLVLDEEDKALILARPAPSK